MMDLRKPPSILMLFKSAIGNVGGMEYSAIRLSQRLRSLGHDVEFLQVCPIREALARAGRLRGEIAGVPVRSLPSLKRWQPVFFVSFGVASSLALASLRGRFDILHVHQLSEYALPAILTARRLRMRVVVKMTSAGEQGDLARLRARAHPWLVGALLRRVDRFVALTPELQAELVGAGVAPDRIAVIPNGVDTGAFRPPASEAERSALRAELGLPPGPLFAFVGRLVAKKRVDLLLRAWTLVSGRVPDAQLAILGDGPLYASLAQQAREAGLAGSVHFVGESHRVADYLRTADGFVLPSVSEGLSNALLEAMSSGLPAVVTDSPGARSLIRDGENGRLLAGDAPEGLAELLVGLAERPAERRVLGRRARATVEAEYGLESVARRYEALYDTLLGRATSRGEAVPRHGSSRTGPAIS